MQELSYPARPAKLKLPTLVYRRNRGDEILTYRLMMANTLPVLFSTVIPNSRTRGHQSKLVKQPTYSKAVLNSCNQQSSALGINSLKNLLLLNLWTFLNKDWVLFGPLESKNTTGKLWISTVHLAI